MWQTGTNSSEEPGSSIFRIQKTLALTEQTVVSNPRMQIKVHYIIHNRSLTGPNSSQKNSVYSPIYTSIRPNLILYSCLCICIPKWFFLGGGGLKCSDNPIFNAH